MRRQRPPSPVARASLNGRVHPRPLNRLVRTPPQGATLRRRGTQRPPQQHARPQPPSKCSDTMEWSQRPKLEQERISIAFCCPFPFSNDQHHFDPLSFAISVVIFQRSGWAVMNALVNRTWCSWPRAACMRTRKADPRPCFTLTDLPKATATTHLRRSAEEDCAQLALHEERLL